LYTTSANINIAYGDKTNTNLTFTIKNIYSSPATVISSNVSTLIKSDFFDISEVWQKIRFIFIESYYDGENNCFDGENKYGMIFFT